MNCSEDTPVKNIISASRRTDIPRYYGDWLKNRRRAGSARFRSAYGTAGEVSLEPDDVFGYLFWTRYAHPRRFLDQLKGDLLASGVPCVFQYTVTGYGPPLEPHLPRISRVIDNFLQVARSLPDPGCIQWRYDPIVLSDDLTPDFHRENFRSLARELEGATRVVNTSVVEPYLKAIRRMSDPSAIYRRVDPGRHKTVHLRHPDLGQPGRSLSQLVAELREIASEHGMELRTCANPELDLPAAQCCGLELFAPYGNIKELEDIPSKPSRPFCDCLETVDIGMDNSCLGGCKYCYVVISHASAVKNFRNHDPHDPMIRPAPCGPGSPPMSKD